MRLVKAGERFCLNISEESLIVETFHSTDEGVAFWLSCEGKEIYHAGDLNNWWWEGEDMAWNRNMAASYKQEMKKLSGRTADLAFIPVDPRLGQWFYLALPVLWSRRTQNGFSRCISGKIIRLYQN